MLLGMLRLARPYFMEPGKAKAQKARGAIGTMPLPTRLCPALVPVYSPKDEYLKNKVRSKNSES